MDAIIIVLAEVDIRGRWPWTLSMPEIDVHCGMDNTQIKRNENCFALLLRSLFLRRHSESCFSVQYYQNMKRCGLMMFGTAFSHCLDRSVFQYQRHSFSRIRADYDFPLFFHKVSALRLLFICPVHGNC